MYASKRIGLASRGKPASSASSGSSILKTLLILLFSSFTFLAGVIIGTQFFDVHREGGGGSGGGKWIDLIKSRLSPPRLRGPAGPATVVAAASPSTLAVSSPAEAQAPTELAPPTVWGTLSSAIHFSAPVDAAELSFFAWVYYPSSSLGADMMVIASNRKSGCDVDAAHRGYTFYINNWATGDEALVLEWRDSGSSGSGCARLSSEHHSIPRDTWVYIGFAFQGARKGRPGKAMLFLNGELLVEAPSARKITDVQRGATAQGLVLGATVDDQFRFPGRISNVVATVGVMSPLDVLALGGSSGDTATWAEAAAALADSHTVLLAAVLAPRGGPSPAVVGHYSATVDATIVTELSGNTVLLGEGEGLQQPREASAVVGVEEGKETAPAPPAPQKQRIPAAESKGSAGERPPGIDNIPGSIRRGAVPGTPPPGSFDFSRGGNQWADSMIRVPLAQASGSVTDPKALAAGTFSDEVTAEEMARSDEQGRERALAVKAAMQHAWSGYKSKAWGADEVRPRSGTRQDNWAGIGMTLIDSLDTLWIMGMAVEFEEATKWVEAHLDFNKAISVSVFETTIRALGGLLAAFDLSGKKVFLDKAKDLGNRLLPAFNTGSGIPRASIVLSSGSTSNPGWTGGSSILAELGTLQVEFRYLSRATGDPEFGRKAERVIEKMDAVHPTNGLYPIFVSADTGSPTTSQVTFGALGDSFYEYLLKVWVQGGRKEPMYRRMYDTAMEGMTSVLLKHSRPSSLAYVADWNGANTEDKMDHLVCFVPGMLALGAYTSGGTAGERNAARDLTNAKALAYTCWQMYARQATGIAPEYVDFPGGADLTVPERAPFYILRPEASESLYILHQLTGNPIYREWGWKMFQAIEKYCHAEFGYGAYPDVRDTGRQPDDRMESFFLAETLKYLYMLQSPDHSISLQKYVFNTEAHPLSAWT